MSRADRVPVRLALGSGVELDVGAVPEGLLRDWIASVTMPNPRYAEAVRAGRHTKEPRELTGMVMNGDRVRLARGGLARYRQVAAEHGTPLAFVDARAGGSPLELTHTRELRDYQANAVSEAVSRQQVVVVAPAGAGKTTVAMGIMAKAQRSTLILVGTIDLATQWRAEVHGQLGVAAGLVASGSFDLQGVTVALVPSLARLTDEVLADLLSRFGVLIIDECHHCASPTWRRVVDASPAKYRIGLSATPAREDGLSPLLEWFIGPAVETVEHAELIRAGSLISTRIVQLETDYRYAYRGPDDWAPMLEDLVSDERRNRLIVESVCAESQADRSVLVLTGRTAHADALASALAEMGVTAAALHGKKPKKQRAELLARAKSGDLRVLVATQLADEGLDLPLLSRVYLTWPAKAAGRTEQRLGRVMRPHSGKADAVLVDVVDVNVGVLKWQALQRAAVFAAVLGPAGTERVA
ncbi:MAG: hypothetical protein RLZZ450_319 [Pseudomonadota bacterium]